MACNSSSTSLSLASAAACDEDQKLETFARPAMVNDLVGAELVKQGAEGRVFLMQVNLLKPSGRQYYILYSVDVKPTVVVFI